MGIASRHLYQLGLTTAELDRQPMDTLVSRISEVFRDFEPEEVLLPHPGDAHSDHRHTFEAASACTKWFRYPSVKRVLTYETISETDVGLDTSRGFQPTVFVDISEFLGRKIELMQLYASEMGAFPFPRSEEALQALAQVRGAQAGYAAAEGFMLLRERS
ncbi:MAG: LmbE family protein [Chloroflexota bacterium]|nr:LmbE family protein [Chloroflexota bacterium]